MQSLRLSAWSAIRTLEQVPGQSLSSLGSPAPLHSFAFENEDVWLSSTCRLNSHGQSLAVWRKLDMLCVGHLAISLLSELESAGIHAARRRHGARWRVHILHRVVLAVKLHIFRGVLCLIDEGKAAVLIGLHLDFDPAGLFADAIHVAAKPEAPPMGV